MDNPETLATLGTYATEEWTIPETLATLGTHETEDWTIQKHWQHWVHTAQRNGQYRNTGKIG